MSEPTMQENQILGAREVPLTIRRLAMEILEKYPEEPIAFVGIHTRGVVLADRLVAELSAHRGDIEQGTLDIALYRDDLENLRSLPSIQGSDIPFDVEGATILLCDDVLFTGRTIRAAMNVLLDYGRPARIRLVVLADRGHRELPIAADFIGVNVATRRRDYLRVFFQETDGHDQVVHHARGEG